MSELVKNRRAEKGIYHRIKEIIESARNNISRAVNWEMVQAYWLIGREIVQEEQRGRSRAEYGEKLLARLSGKLTNDFGKGFNESNLRNIRQFYLIYPIRDALRSELSWTHYRILMRMDNQQARSFYEIECAKNNRSSRSAKTLRE